MAGRMGAERHTTQNLTVHAVDVEKSLLLIKGAVPGARGQRRPRTHRREGSLNAMSTIDVTTPWVQGRYGRPAGRSSTYRPTSRCIHQVVVAQLAAARQGTHKTKTRAEVSRWQVASRSSRRAPAAPVRVRSVLLTSTGGGVVHGPHAA